MTTNWTERLLEQLTYHWDHSFRPKLDTLTGDEYFWEPVPGCWTVRQVDGEWRGDVAEDGTHFAPDPQPVTTIAWRLSHVTVGVLAMRNAIHFGGPPADYPMWEYAPTARQALAQLDEAYARWTDGVRGLDADALERPIGPGEGPWADRTYADLVLHINREVLHHGAEILLLRDLYRSRDTGAQS